MSVQGVVASLERGVREMELSVMLSRAHLRLLVLSVFSLLLASASIASASAYHSSEAPPAMVRLPGHVLPALAKATIIPSKSNSGAQPITLTIVLKRDDQAGFESYLHEIYDPRSKNLHKFLTQRQIANRFGPSRADYDSILAYLHANGFKLVRGSANRLTLTVRGSRAGAERAFTIRIGDYQANGRTFYANASDPALPAQLAAHVQAIAGLSTQQKPHHAYIAAAIKCGATYITTPACYFTSGFDYKACVNDVANKITYNFVTGCSVTAGPIQFDRAMAKSPLTSVPWNQVDGTGQTIGLLEFDTFNTSDLFDYLALPGQSPALIDQLSVVPVNGGVSAPGPDQSEVLLDIDTTLTLAPGANTV